jgi:hypothetical protein
MSFRFESINQVVEASRCFTGSVGISGLDGSGKKFAGLCATELLGQSGYPVLRLPGSGTPNIGTLTQNLHETGFGGPNIDHILADAQRHQEAMKASYGKGTNFLQDVIAYHAALVRLAQEVSDTKPETRIVFDRSGLDVLAAMTPLCRRQGIEPHQLIDTIGIEPASYLIRPERSIWLDVPHETALQRIRSRESETGHTNPRDPKSIEDMAERKSGYEPYFSSFQTQIIDNSSDNRIHTAIGLSRELQTGRNPVDAALSAVWKESGIEVLKPDDFEKDPLPLNPNLSGPFTPESKPQKGAVVSAHLWTETNDRMVVLTKDTGQESWNLPGNGIKEHESPQTAVRRTVQNQLGLTVPENQIQRIGCIGLPDSTVSAPTRAEIFSSRTSSVNSVGRPNIGETGVSSIALIPTQQLREHVQRNFGHEFPAIR